MSFTRIVFKINTWKYGFYSVQDYFVLVRCQLAFKVIAYLLDAPTHLVGGYEIVMKLIVKG